MCPYADSAPLGHRARADPHRCRRDAGRLSGTTTIFGDPAYGIPKSCFIEAPPPAATTWTPCAAETATCTLATTHDVAFGNNGDYAYRTATASTTCTNAVFGDPAPGAVKACYVQ